MDYFLIFKGPDGEVSSKFVSMFEEIAIVTILI